jgi:hypothetical protein
MRTDQPKKQPVMNRGDRREASKWPLLILLVIRALQTAQAEWVANGMTLASIGCRVFCWHWAGRVGSEHGFSLKRLFQHVLKKLEIMKY